MTDASEQTTPESTEQDVLSQAAAVLDYGPICDHCLGRMFGKRSFALSNAERGRALRTAVALQTNTPFEAEVDGCWICENICDETDELAEHAVAALEGIECNTMLVGSRVPPMISESEEMVWSDLGLASPEPLKAQINREVGKKVSAATGIPVEFTRPDLVIILDLATKEAEIQINPVYIYGRYCKYERGIPQTRWHCIACQGRGCERCNFTGKMYETSVEELIGGPVIVACDAEDAILHGAGREDIDARMLGDGRPFVLEVVHPLKRTASLAELEKEVNDAAAGRVSITLDHLSSRREVERIKSGKAHKKYSILVEIDGSISENELESAIKALKGTQIAQRTPERVAHRRADKIRKRRVVDISCSGMEEDLYRIEITGEAGLYIKELISGDNERTDPNLAGILGKPARVIYLDVVMVEGVVPETSTNKSEE